jgi:transposase InsO family protein
MNTDDKLKLVDPNCSQLSVSRQCCLLALSRSRFYYKPKGIDNVFIERFWRTIKYDKLYLYTIENGHHALELCEEFMEYYNHKRMHSSINDKTPMQIYKEAA